MADALNEAVRREPTIVAKAFAVTLFAGLLSSVPGAACAQEPELKTFVSPAFEGFAMAFDIPQSGDWVRGMSNHAFGSSVWIDYSGDMKDLHAAPRIGLSLGLYKRPRTFDRMVEEKIRSWKDYAMIVHDHGEDDTFGQRTFFFTNSDETCLIDGNQTACPRPQRKEYLSVMHGTARAQFYIHTRHADDFDRFRPLFERMARTVRIIPESELDPAETSQFYSSPSVRTSERRGHYLENSIKLLMPPGWTAEEAEVRSAGNGDEQGRLLVYLQPPSDDRPEPATQEILYAIVDGMPYSVLQASEYIATADNYVDALLTDRQEIETPASVKLPGRPSNPDGFCLAKAKTRYSTGTDTVRVKTYAGKDQSGRDVRLRIYTAGGVTQVCNLIYVADPATFDAAQQRLDAIIETVEVETFDPAWANR